MRRVFGVTLTGLGAFLIVLAAMCRFYLPGQVIKFPLNEYSVSTLSGTNMSYFSQQTGSVVNGATVRAISTVQGDVSCRELLDRRLERHHRRVRRDELTAGADQLHDAASRFQPPYRRAGQLLRCRGRDRAPELLRSGLRLAHRDAAEDLRGLQHLADEARAVQLHRDIDRRRPVRRRLRTSRSITRRSAPSRCPAPLSASRTSRR